MSDHAGGAVDGVANLAVVVGGEGAGEAGQVGDSDEPASLGRFDERPDDVLHLSEGARRVGGRVGRSTIREGESRISRTSPDGLFR